MERDGLLDDNGIRWLKAEPFYDGKNHLDSYPDFLETLPKSQKPSKDAKKQYLLTFTRDPGLDVHLWFQRLCIALQSKMLKTMNASIEHIDKNIHCHALVTTTCSLSRDKFVSFLKDARNPQRALDIRKVANDNGISEYINKESKAFDNLEEFKNYYLPLIV